MTPQTAETAERSHSGHPRAAWDAIAAAYDRHVAPGESEVARVALRLVDLCEGERFLDVAAGPGGLSLPAARMGARVTATDWSPAMIERLEARAESEGLTQLIARVMDCHSLDFADGSFDVAGSLFGLMLVPDQPAALRELHRVVRPGGRVVLVAYGDPEAFEALHLFVSGLATVIPDFPGVPSDPPPLEFQVSDPEVLRRRLSEAGFRDVTVDTEHSERLDLYSGQQLWDWCLGGNPIPSMLVADLDEAQRSSVRAHLEASIRQRAGRADYLTVSAPLNIGVGVR